MIEQFPIWTITEEISYLHDLRISYGVRRGQYGVVSLRLIPEPLQSEIEITVAAELVGPTEYLDAIQGGIREYLDEREEEEKPLSCFRILIIGMKYHDVDSSIEGMQRQGYRALKSALHGREIETEHPSEEQWLNCQNPILMRNLNLSSGRQDLLFACACCRHFEERLSPRRLLGVEKMEQVADGELTMHEITTEFPEAPRVLPSWDPLSHGDKLELAARSLISEGTADSQIANQVMELTRDVPPDEHAVLWQADLIREIVGNPFSPPWLDPSWLNPTVTNLAEVIYRDRLFEDLPILGDALEDAGCNNVAILDHCRSNKSHVLGCWVLDLLLGREAQSE